MATYQPLIQATFVAAASGVLYTAAQRTRFDRFTATNQTGSPVALTLRIAPGGAADSNVQRIYLTANIPGDGRPVELYGMLHTLNVGDVIRGNAGSANAISVFASGVKF